MTTETVAVQIAASKLCLGMGEAFKNEAERGEAFDECVDGVLEKGEVECKFQPYPTSHYGKIDRCIREANIPIALCEDKLEFGLGGPGAYMQLARCYDLVVEVLTTLSVKENHKQLRTTICIKVYERTMFTTWNRMKPIDRLSLSDWWTNGKSLNSTSNFIAIIDKMTRQNGYQLQNSLTTIGSTLVQGNHLLWLT